MSGCLEIWGSNFNRRDLAILNHKCLFTGGKRSVTYLIKWAGFSDVHDSWEPEGNLLKYVPEMLSAYKASHQVANVYSASDPSCVLSGRLRTSEKSKRRRTFGAPQGTIPPIGSTEPTPMEVDPNPINNAVGLQVSEPPHGLRRSARLKVPSVHVKSVEIFSMSTHLSDGFVLPFTILGNQPD